MEESSRTNRFFIPVPLCIYSPATNHGLQASNDIIGVDPVNIATAGITFTAQAGQSILMQSGFSLMTNAATIDLTADETRANGVVDADRDAGNAVISMASG